MNTKLLVTALLLNFFFVLSAQTNINPEQIRKTQRSVCAIKIIDTDSDVEKVIAVGCGVVLISELNNRNEYFIATALHVIDNLLKKPGYRAEIMVFDKYGNLFKTSYIGKEYIIWFNKDADAALIVLPHDLNYEGELPSDYINTGLSNLEMIGEPDWGQDIYLFGYRWMNENLFLDILKKGILSIGTTQLPGYEGHLVYLIDNMANKGMSGGLAFTEKGTGIGIISSYVYEVNTNFQNSDDLTVCLPLPYYFKALSEVIISDRDKISKLVEGN